MFFISDLLRAGMPALIVVGALLPVVPRALVTDALAADNTLSLAQAQRIAVERSRQLYAQDAAVSASREMAVAAGRLPDPVLRLGIDNLPADGADRLVAVFLADNYARPNKRGGAWMDDAITRRRKGSGVQTPVSYLNCNFSSPLNARVAFMANITFYKASSLP